MNSFGGYSVIYSVMFIVKQINYLKYFHKYLKMTKMNILYWYMYHFLK